MRATHDETSSASAISNGAVHLLHEYTGRGPTRARTIMDDEVVTVLLGDLLTKGERSLVAAGAQERVLEYRWAFQAVMRDELIALVERETGRKVTAFMSANHVDPDLAVETFVLERR